MESQWKTNPRSGRAHLVSARLPVCGSPVPPGGVTWARTGRGHVRCADCLKMAAGAASRTELDAQREAGVRERDRAHRALNLLD